MNKIKGRIGFIGAGNMGEAIAGAIVGAELAAPDTITMSDVSETRLEYMNRTYGVKGNTNNTEVFLESGIVVLAVKPQQMDAVLAETAGAPSYDVTDRKIVISIAAGIRIERIENILYAPLDASRRKNLPIIRVMPNTPALVLSGMSGMSHNIHAIPEDLDAAEQILTAMGKVYRCPESRLDAVTAVSGSGPAYVFYLIEAMIEGGVQAGLPEKDAETLALATIEGALRLMAEKGEPAQSLRKKVTSPGGTTEAALNVMESGAVKSNIVKGIKAAADRAAELSAV